MTDMHHEGDAVPEDYAFRYRLYPKGNFYHHEKLVELIRAEFESLLNLTRIFEKQTEVRPDSFRLLNDNKTCRELFKQRSNYTSDNEVIDLTCDNTSLYEPRIDFIRQQLQNLLSVVELEKDGQVVEVDGFRLKNLNDWLVPSSRDPSGIAVHLATKCNCDCNFCYLKGNPPSVVLKQPRRPAEDELHEAMTRVKYWSPRAGRALFPNLGGIYEVLSHPGCISVLQALREKSDKPFRLTTNGESLNSEMVAKLDGLRPLYLYVSLNSSSPQRRRLLMRSKRPRVAIDSLQILREYSIPYAVVIVPWPVDGIDEMLDDLSQTVAFADDHGSHLVQINLPGYSQYFSEQKLFDLDDVWSATLSCIGKLRKEFSTPIIAMPTLYEENFYQDRKNLPYVVGIVRNSPAASCGLRQGDLIVRLNELNVRNRPQARDILSNIRRGQRTMVDLVVQRGDSEFNLVINLDNHEYPYSVDTDNHLGIILLGTGLRVSDIERMRDIIEARKVKHVLFLSSRLVKPTLEQCLNDTHLLSNPNWRVDIEIPRNRFFGGNIFMGDLLVVEDFIQHIREYIENQGVMPELVIIPSTPFSLGQWGRDITGRPYLDIERNVGIPVELLECDPILD
ncbi:MAG: radical SAM protein [Chloroflexota bacterium]|nr:radical SAM protein [Chloroflexota bacterium]